MLGDNVVKKKGLWAQRSARKRTGKTVIKGRAPFRNHYRDGPKRYWGSDGADRER